MASVVSIPGRLHAILAEGAVNGELPRWALGAVLVGAVREGRASRGFLHDALGLSVNRADDLLASYGVVYDIGDEDLHRDVLNARSNP